MSKIKLVRFIRALGSKKEKLKEKLQKKKNRIS